MASRIGRALVFGTVLGALLGVPTLAAAAEAVPSIAATAPYNLDFTLPTESKSGCMVCHGDPALVRVRDGVVRSYYISDATVAASAHANQQCVGCHVDFTYSAPHGQSDWTVAAKSACRNCHEQASIDFQVGVHRPSVTSTATAPAATAATPSAEASAPPKPLCGDCHGAHDISYLTTDTPEAKAGRAALHRNGWEVCGRCHEDYWDSYADYYHGAAYKRGALDAPSCWDCHGWHDILPSKERGSFVNEAHLKDTCSGQNLPVNDGRRCHAGVDDTYVDYAKFIHGREEVAAKNPILSLWRSVRQAIGRFFGGDEGR